MTSQIGLTVTLPAYKADPAFVARRAEELGFESIWFAEHPILPVESDSPFPGSEDGIIPWTYAHFTEPYIALARASAVTTDLKLGTGITLITERNPLVLAKVIAALDFYSGGRFLFGIGTGWHREETELMGGDFDHRCTQAREAALALKALWTEDEAEFHGKYYDFPPVQCYPKAGAEAAPAYSAGRHGEECVAAHRALGRRLAAEPRNAGAGARESSHARHACGGVWPRSEFAHHQHPRAGA